MTTAAKELSWLGEYQHALAVKQYCQGSETTYAEVVERVAAAITQDPTDRARYLELMASGRFAPGGRILAGAGTKHGNLLNCFVQGATVFAPECLAGVMELSNKLAQVTKVGGGSGVSLDAFAVRSPSRLGPKPRLIIYIDPSHENAQDVLIGNTQNPSWPKPGEKVRRGYRVAMPTVDRDTLVGLYNPPITFKVDDSIDSIWESAARMIQAFRGGSEVIIDLSALRAEGAPIAGSGGLSTGPAAFAVEVFDQLAYWYQWGAEHSGPVRTLRYALAPTLRAVAQGGSRRGAGMAAMAVTNPHILDFITCKDADRIAAEGDLSTFNISVKATDDFMRAAETGQMIELRDPMSNEPVRMTDMIIPYNKYNLQALIDDGLLEERKSGGTWISAQWLMRELAAHAHATGDPGLFFIDTANATFLSAERMECTNPCGEIPLTVGESCDLGALNLGKYVYNARFDFEAFAGDVRTAVRFLDDVLDANVFALPDNQEASLRFRRLGLGVMGLADCLALLGLRYDSDQAELFTQNLASQMAETAHHASVQLGLERGVPTGCLEADVDRRNIAILTVAPTGTTSQVLGASGGIEPHYALAYDRRVGGEIKHLIEPIVYHVKDKSLLRTAAQISVDRHIRVQAAFQLGMDSGGFGIGNSISKTVNLPAAATVEDVLHAYHLAHVMGCKGTTVYRDGSLQDQVLMAVDESATAAPGAPTSPANPPTLPPSPAGQPEPWRRPETLDGATSSARLTDPASGMKTTYLVTVNRDDGGRALEVILTAGRAGSLDNANAEALGRVVSLALQGGVTAARLCTTLRGINGGLMGSIRHQLITSPADLIAVALNDERQPGPDDPLACPACDATLAREEGCLTCHFCGYSHCG